MTDSKQCLVLLEFPGDASHLDGLGWLQGEAIQRVCMTPAAAGGLEARGLDYRFVHELISSAAIQGELDDNWRRLEDLAALINEYVPYGWTAAYYLKCLLDTCMEKIIHLTGVLQETGPAGQIVALQTRPLKHDYTLVFDEAESLYTLLLPLVAAVHAPGRELVLLPSAGERPGSGPRVLSHLKRWLSPYRDLPANMLQRSARGKMSGSPVCLVEEGSGLEGIISQLARSSPVVRWAPWSAWSLPPGLGWRAAPAMFASVRQLSQYRRACYAAWNGFRDDPRTRPLFTCRQVDFFDTVSSRLEFLFTRVFPHLFVLQERAANFFQRRRVACLVSANFSRPYTYVLAQVARSRGVPVVTVQHSAYGYWRWPIAKYFDGVMSDCKLVGGEGVAQYVQQVECSGCRPIPTGLIPLDGLVRNETATPPCEEGRPKVVYPLASYVKNFIHYSHSRLALTEYYEINRRILQTLGKFPDVDVVVRPHPAWRFKANAAALQDWAERQGWTHIHFETKDSAFAAMVEADLIVIDSPSTVLLQAVATDRKILLLNRVFPLTELGAAALKRRVVYSDKLDSFLALLEDTLRRRDFCNRCYQDSTFLRLYGTHLHDGRSLERSVAAVQQIAQSGSKEAASGQ